MNRIFNLISWVGIALVVAALGVFYGMPAQVGPLARVLCGLAAGHEPTKKYATATLDTVSALAKTKVGLDAMHSTKMQR